MLFVSYDHVWTFMEIHGRDTGQAACGPVIDRAFMYSAAKSMGGIYGGALRIVTKIIKMTVHGYA